MGSVRVRLHDDEVLVSGAHVNETYENDPDAGARFKVRDPDGTVWHRTGDAARLDDDGRLWILGRVEHRFERSGVRLYPTALEVAARSQAGVSQAAVLEHQGRLTLVVGGDSVDEAALGRLHPAIDTVRRLRKIPTDRRHNAKIDYAALRQSLAH